MVISFQVSASNQNKVNIDPFLALIDILICVKNKTLEIYFQASYLH